MRSSRLLIVFCGIFMITLVASLPARLIFNLAAPDGIQADIVSGTAWSMQIRRLSIADQTISHGRLTVSPFSLLHGSLKTRVKLTDRDVDVDGQLQLSPGSIRLTEANLIIPPSRIRPLQSSPVPLTSPIQVQIDNLLMRQGQCLEANGQVTTRILADQGERWGLALPVLIGELVCLDDSPVINLSGESDLLSVTGFVRLDLDRYRWSAVAQTQDRDVMAVLLAMDFEQSGERWRLEGDGVYQ